jgi:hypothetical protein
MSTNTLRKMNESAHLLRLQLAQISLQSPVGGTRVTFIQRRGVGLGERKDEIVMVFEIVYRCGVLRKSDGLRAAFCLPSQIPSGIYYDCFLMSRSLSDEVCYLRQLQHARGSILS